MSSQPRNDICNPTPLQCTGLKHVVLGGFFCLFLVLGMPFLFLGCNPDVDNMCRIYDIVQGTTYGYRLVVETCEDCESNSEGGEYCGPQYTCYQGFVKLQYDEPGDNCEFKYRRRYGAVERAMYALHKDYPINSTHTFILQKRELDNNKNCLELKHGKGVWTGGVVLLCLAAVVLLGWIIYGFFSYKDVITLLSNLQYVPVNYNTSPSITSTSDPNVYTDPNVASHHSPNHSPYAPVSGGMEMVRTAPTVQYPLEGQTNSNTNTTSYKGNPNTATVTPYPAYGSSTPNYISNTNNSSYNPHYTSNTITATPTAPVYPTASPTAYTTPNIPYNITAKPNNPSLYPAYTPVTAYPTAIPYSPPVSVPYSAGVIQPSVSVHASSAHEEYDMY